MSECASKTVLRAEVKALRGKNIAEAFAYFHPILGEPEEVEGTDGVVEFFYYERKPLHIIPVKDNGENPEKEERWGVEYLLEQEQGIETETKGYSLSGLQQISENLQATFGVEPEDVKLYSYTWYDGGDDPVTFE